MTLTPHPLLVPWSWKSRAIPLLPLWAVRPVQSLSACTRVTFTFTFTLQATLHFNVDAFEGNKLRKYLAVEWMKWEGEYTGKKSWSDLRNKAECSWTSGRLLTPQWRWGLYFEYCPQRRGFFRSVRKIAKRDFRFVMSVPHGITRLPPNGFSLNLIFMYLSKNCRENSSFIIIRQ